MLPTNSSNLGVQIQNINIAETLNDSEVSNVREQWVNYGVAVFPKSNFNLEAI